MTINQNSVNAFILLGLSTLISNLVSGWEKYSAVLLSLVAIILFWDVLFGKNKKDVKEETK